MGDQDLDYGYYHLGIILQFFAHFSFKHLDLVFLMQFLALYHGTHHHETPLFSISLEDFVQNAAERKRWETPPGWKPPTPGKQVSVASS